ncbi:MAG TPA: class I SAM-dependent methyltransferase [Mycobacteriales bacterium]|jgi:SAM-dependent methyltransferase|nr:class I SAM-dependent methyltransferase [Mycobacteriales bacterium]
MDWESWQQRWDAQQQAYLPDREERFSVMLDAVEAACGAAPRVLDLAGGTGSITRRLLARFPGATSVVLDVDEALLAIARGSFAGDARVRVCRADLATAAWRRQLAEPEASMDAVLTATALHWLTPARVAGVYAESVPLLRAGGVVMNADHIPDPGLGSLSEAIGRLAESRTAQLRVDTGALDWAGWWEQLRADPVLAGPTGERDRHFARPDGRAHTESMLSCDWHIEALRTAGCIQAGLVWRGLQDAVVLGRVC